MMPDSRARRRSPETPEYRMPSGDSRGVDLRGRPLFAKGSAADKRTRHPWGPPSLDHLPHDTPFESSISATVVVGISVQRPPCLDEPFVPQFGGCRFGLECDFEFVFGGLWTSTRADENDLCRNVRGGIRADSTGTPIGPFLNTSCHRNRNP